MLERRPFPDPAPVEEEKRKLGQTRGFPLERGLIAFVVPGNAVAATVVAAEGLLPVGMWMTCS